MGSMDWKAFRQAYTVRGRLASGPLVVSSISGDCGSIPLMKIVTLILLGVLIYAVISTHLTVRRSQSEKERAFAIRISAFSWLVGFLLLLAFVFLPGKGRVLMMLPVFFAVVTLAKFWRNSRERLRREQQAEVDMDRMKRVN
jgi:Na+/H+ antiporter NhaD/arsenite permease-like protein